MADGVTSPNPNKTILLADDEPQLRNLLCLILETCGYSLLVAKDAQDALEIVSKSAEPIDLLVSDIEMPGMTGPELAKQIRRFRPYLKILLISGYSRSVLTVDEG